MPCVGLMIISGGDQHASSLIKCEIPDNTCLQMGSDDYLSSELGNEGGEFGYGVYFTQINATTLYTINPNGDAINVYDLQYLSYDALDTSIPTNVSSESCISSSETPAPRLYITGGTDGLYAINNLQILSMDDLQWLTQLPSMVYHRHFHG